MFGLINVFQINYAHDLNQETMWKLSKTVPLVNTGIWIKLPLYSDSGIEDKVACMRWHCGNIPFMFCSVLLSDDVLLAVTGRGPITVDAGGRMTLSVEGRLYGGGKQSVYTRVYMAYSRWIGVLFVLFMLCTLIDVTGRNRKTASLWRDAFICVQIFSVNDAGRPCG